MKFSSCQVKELILIHWRFIKEQAGRKPKIVYHHANQKNYKRCFVKILKIYIKTLTCLYFPRPIGHDTLSKTLPRLCKSAGIQGFKTNHSLKATAATRLYRSGIDEQLVMERTGHRSLEGVRNYKRTSDQHGQVLSDMLNMDPRINVPGTIATPCSCSLMSVEEQNMVATFSSSSLVPVEEQNKVENCSSSSLVSVGGQNFITKPTATNTCQF